MLQERPKTVRTRNHRIWRLELPDRVITLCLVVLLAVMTPAVGLSESKEEQPEKAIATATTLSALSGIELTDPILTIDEAIELAVSNSPMIAIAVDNTLKAENQSRAAARAGKLQVSVQSQYVRLEPSSTMSFPGSDGTPIQIETRPSSQLTASASAALPIDISRRIAVGRELARLNIGIQGYSAQQSLQQLICDVKSAYYNVLRAQASVGVAQSAISAAEERLRVSKAQFNVGLSPKFDVMQAEVDVANLNQMMIQAQNGVDASKGVLNRLIGLDANTPFEVEEPTTGTIAAKTLDIPALTQQALTVRPEIMQSTVAITAAEKGVQFARTEDKPTLAAFVTPNYTNNASAFSPDKMTYSYGLSATWSIWNSGVTRANVAVAKNDLDMAQQGLKAASLGVELDVRTSALSVMEASRRVQTAQSNVDLAKEAQRLSNVRYKEGVSTQVEVSSAEAALTQALNNLVSARYDYLTAVAQLERATVTQPEYEVYTLPGVPSLPTTAKEASRVDLLSEKTIGIEGAAK